MAERRMITRKVTDDDNFIALSSSAQALYLHLNMSADDDGFCNQISTAMFRSHASVQDLEALLSKRFLLQFDSGVIVIKHWRMANALRKDRYTPTAFQEEMAKLKLKDNSSYTISEDVVASWLPDGCQVVAERLPQARQDKDRIDKDSIGKASQGAPSLDDVKKYAQETGSNVVPERFYKFYSDKDWMTGSEKINDWKALFRKWSADEKPKKQKQYSTAKEYASMMPKKIDAAAVNKVADMLKQWDAEGYNVGVIDCTTSE